MQGGTPISAPEGARELERVVTQVAKYGVVVRILGNPGDDDELGAINGGTMDVVLDCEEWTITVFTICHLFGHMVQFTDYSRYAELVEGVAGPLPVVRTAEFWEAFRAYEHEAFAYGRTLLSGGAEIDRRYAIFMDSDFAHFKKVVTGGNRLGRRAFRRWLRWRYQRMSGSDIGVSPIPLPPPAALKWTRQVSATIY